MARHRKIHVCMYADDKFRRLSKPQPNAQTLWVYLLTGPHTTSIPGLIVAGEAALAEALGWPLEAFRYAFREVIKEGMLEADLSARVLWIPNAIHYNRPESVNVVKGWRHYWDEVPQCKLKVKAYQHLKAYLEGIGVGFADAFSWAVPKLHEKASANQEQEQEQEQEEDKLPCGDSEISQTELPEVKRPEETTAKVIRVRRRDDLFDAISHLTGSDSLASGSHIGRVCSALRKADPPYTHDEVNRLPEALAKNHDWFDGKLTLGMIEKYIGLTRKPLPVSPQKGARHGPGRPQANPGQRFTEAAET